MEGFFLARYRGTSPIQKRLPVGPYSRAIPKALWWSEGGRGVLMSEVPLYDTELRDALQQRKEVL